MRHALSFHVLRAAQVSIVQVRGASRPKGSRCWRQDFQKRMERTTGSKVIGNNKGKKSRGGRVPSVTSYTKQTCVEGDSRLRWRLFCDGSCFAGNCGGLWTDPTDCTRSFRTSTRLVNWRHDVLARWHIASRRVNVCARERETKDGERQE